MIFVFLVLLVLCTLAIQYRSAERALERLNYQNTLDRDLAEPDQIVTLISMVRNIGRLPVFYLNFMETLPEKTHPEEDETWQKHHLKRALFGLYCTSTLSLPAHRRYTRAFRFSLPERGSYLFGKHYVVAGDFLGVRTRYREGNEEKKLVVMPRRREDPQLALTLGGYIGEISVRRFIFEDPVLTIGVREYTGNEPIKQISWKQTARTGTLQVKNYDFTADANVTVLLNIDGGSPEDLERCFETVRTVCEMLERRRIPYEFYGNGDFYGPKGELGWFYEGLGDQHFRTLMYALGQTRGVVLFPFSTMVERCGKRRRTSRGYIVISPPLRDGEREALRTLRRLSETEPCLLIAKAEEGGTSG